MRTKIDYVNCISSMKTAQQTSSLRDVQPVDTIRDVNVVIEA